MQSRGLQRICFFSTTYSKSTARGAFPLFLDIIVQNIPYRVEYKIICSTTVSTISLQPGEAPIGLYLKEIRKKFGGEITN